MARPPHPLELKIAKGTNNATREELRAEITPESIDVNETTPPPPADLTDSGREVWARLCEQQGSVGILFPSTLDYIHAYCRAHDLREYFFSEIQAHGVYTEDKRAGTRMSQAYKAYNEQVNIMLAIGGKLGLSPVDKTKVSQIIVDKTALKNAKKRIGVLG